MMEGTSVEKGIARENMSLGPPEKSIRGFTFKCINCTKGTKSG